MKVDVSKIDAPPQIGTGYFVRCWNLAFELRDRGVAVEFICRGTFRQLMRSLRSRFHTNLIAASTKRTATSEDYAAWLGVPRRLMPGRPSMPKGDGKLEIVVDHLWSRRYMERLIKQHRSPRILVIDDLADRPHDCDVPGPELLRGSATRYAALVPRAATNCWDLRLCIVAPRIR